MTSDYLFVWWIDYLVLWPERLLKHTPKPIRFFVAVPLTFLSFVILLPFHILHMLVQLIWMAWEDA